MNNIDYLNLDARLLRMFVCVYERRSVTAAALELGLTQSTVSHALNRLRKILQDELFVPSGRSIVATPKADLLIPQAREILASLERFTTPDSYTPSADTGRFRLAANDYEIETLVKPLLDLLRQVAPGVSLEVLPARSQSQWADLLRTGKVDLALSPTLESSEPDLVQTPLFSDREMLFYDPSQQQAPTSIEDYAQKPHGIMAFDGHHPTDIDRKLEKLGLSRRTLVTAPSFSALASLVRGSNMLVAMPGRLASSLFTGFSCCELPFEVAPFDIVQVWHIRHRHWARHQWLRKQLELLAAKP